MAVTRNIQYFYIQKLENFSMQKLITDNLIDVQCLLMRKQANKVII